ncbi:Amino acid ABC transporter, ATP-binding protein [Pseudomonas amygdali pv. dendropanacis]|uniref:Amino acid ABC transporter, ATP-binding protein n=1 Tax=Pseudomonas amygdali pv. dendropanacis TaxID=235272 RepID=A0A0P9TSI0_PSEA0|nr:Amino acid ABC transporter, ATP-binding protein [Pseudomonas amygdali pv. dendropanacis]
MAEATPALEIRNLHKRYDQLEVLKGISLTARDGDVISILGSSGSGKSTLLRCINLLENPHQGQILVAGEELKLKAARNGDLIAADNRQINRLRSQIGFVFQNFNLWPHMSVLDNIIEAPRRVLGQSKAEAIEVAEELLAKVGIADKRHAYPAQLSGGQQQRVRWPCSRRSFCSTSRHRPSTRRWFRKYSASSAHWLKKAGPCCW